MRARTMIIILLPAVLFLTACGLFENSEEPGERTTATLEPATPVTIADPQSTPQFEIQPTATLEAVELKIWIPPQIAERTEEGARVLFDQLQAFNDEHPDVSIKVEQKQPRGAGGILSYLRTGRGVAPSALPDLVVLPAEMLLTAGNENLIFPLDEAFDPGEIDLLFPSALQLAQPQENILGYPFALSGLPHIVYNSNVLTSTLPLTWERLIANPDRNLVMAGGGSDGALLALQFYLDAGGKVENELEQPILEIGPLTVALDALEEGRESGFIVAESSGTSTEDQAWQIFLGGGANNVRISSDFFLGETTTGLPIQYTVTPGIERPLTPLVTGWAWAISTSEPARREFALELIQNMVTAPNLGTWSQESDILPSRQDALAAWTGENSYTDFMAQELEIAQPLPVTSSSKLLTVLGDAAFEVLSGTKNAEEAAADAVTAFES
jgi:ABC-type glycerol-3-phosphate transport system substrate-binding protein